MLAIQERIREAGLRATRQRVSVLSYLESLVRPESIQEIAASLSKSIDVVTAYRIVESFKAAGLIREVDLRQGRPLFEAAHEDHHHVVCTDCGTVAEFKGCDSEHLATSALKQASNFSAISSHSIELFGLCKKCV